MITTGDIGVCHKGRSITDSRGALPASLPGLSAGGRHHVPAPGSVQPLPQSAADSPGKQASLQTKTVFIPRWATLAVVVRTSVRCGHSCTQVRSPGVPWSRSGSRIAFSVERRNAGDRRGGTHTSPLAPPNGARLQPGRGNRPAAGPWIGSAAGQGPPQTAADSAPGALEQGSKGE